MFSRSLRMVLIVAGLLILIACDPETVIKSKVPEPVRNALTFGPQTTGPKAKQAEAATVEIVAPKADGAYPVGKDIVFQGKAKFAADAKAEKPELVWTLFPEKNPAGVPLGKGISVRKQLDPGRYRAELSMDQEGRKITKNVSFRVVRSISGKVVSVDGSGISGTELDLTDLEGNKVISTTQSGKDGVFSVEIPSEDQFRVVPRKKGFSFSPVSQIIKFSKDAVQPLFKGGKGEISDIRLTESEKSDEAVRNVCPQQEAWLRLSMKFEHKITRVEPLLVLQEKDEQRLIPLDDLTDSTADSKEHDPNAPTVLKVRVPSGPTLGVPAASYRLRVKVYDDTGNSFSSEASAPVKMDMVQCFSGKLAEALSLQEKGNPKEAIKAYTVVEDYGKTVADSRQFSKDMQRAMFNRGIAHLEMAMSKQADQGPILGQLGKAMADFNAVLKVHKRDTEAHLLRGVVAYLARSYKAALEDFDTVLTFDPQMVAARELRAQALVKSGRKINLAPAIDDFTDLVDLDPKNSSFKKSRSETLKLLVQSESEKDDAKVDTSAIAVRGVGEILNVGKYVRK
jgi:tetratricopeptide (TPR) repeat protein